MMARVRPPCRCNDLKVGMATAGKGANRLGGDGEEGGEEEAAETGGRYEDPETITCSTRVGSRKPSHLM